MLWTDDLASRFRQFASAAHTSLHIVAPFIRADALTTMLTTTSAKDVVVVTTWKTADALAGATDVEVYPLCRARGWFLYVHPRLHAKVLAADMRRAVVTSANVTGRALGLVVPGNVECGVCVDPLAVDDCLWLTRIVCDSQLVDAAHYDAFKRHVEAQRLAASVSPPAPFDMSGFDARRHFLLSSLPMSDSPDRVLAFVRDVRSGGGHIISDEDRACALHDMALFGLGLSGDLGDARVLLRNRFFEHPFIRAFATFVEGRRFFGEAKAWVQHNCANVPVPRRRDLTGHVRVLFGWFASLGDGTYTVERPNHSECLVCRDPERFRRPR